MEESQISAFDRIGDVRTDATGRFRFGEAGVGDHTIQVEADGFENVG
jgi:hypothetical protein